MLTLDQLLEFDPSRDEEFFAALPDSPAICRIEPRTAGAQPYLRRTADLRRTCRRLLAVPEPASPATDAASPDAAAPPRKRPRLNLREVAARVRYRLTGSAFEQYLTLYQQARELFPGSYSRRLRLAPPALLKINLANDYPRCFAARRVLDDGAFYFGPFSSRRAAEDFSREFLPLFKIRRCHIKIRRDPDFPGCIYSEMKMCLAPCYAGCTNEEYASEVDRVGNFLGSRGRSLIAELETERDRATAAEEFERAAALHKRHEKVAAVVRRLPELPRRLDQLDAVVLQPAAVEGTVAAFRVRGGVIADPFPINFRELSSLPRSVETIFREFLESDGEPGDTTEPLADHLALLARWFYSKPRRGEIFLRETAAGGGWPYRRIIRACARVLGPQAVLPAARAGNPSPGPAD
jgi:excinuclease ABC subunit C